MTFFELNILIPAIAEFLQIHKIGENVPVDAEPSPGYRDRAVLLLAGERIVGVEPADLAHPSGPNEPAVAHTYQPPASLSEEKRRR